MKTNAQRASSLQCEGESKEAVIPAQAAKSGSDPYFPYFPLEDSQKLVIPAQAGIHFQSQNGSPLSRERRWETESCAPLRFTSLAFLTQASAPEQIEQLAGNKGKSLHRLGSMGAPVPAWAILGANWFAAFRRQSGVEQRIDELLQDFATERAGDIARAIAETIMSCDPSHAMHAAIARALAHLGDGPIAVRSSGVEEDGADFSFAGQFDTFLDVRGLDSTIEHVRKCWASAYSERSLRYRHQHGLDVAATEMAVICAAPATVNTRMPGVRKPTYAPRPPPVTRPLPSVPPKT